MSHARNQQPNVTVTPEGRWWMVSFVLEHGWTIAATAERIQLDAKTVTRLRDRIHAEGEL